MQRLLVGGTIVIVLAVVAVLLYGVLYERVIKQSRPAVTVNGERVSIKQFQGLARYLRFTLIRNANQNFQLVQMFGSDPSTSASFANQLQQIQTQLEPTSIGQQALNQLEQNVIIQAEAKKRGISLTDDKIQVAMQEAFGYFANGTPTPTATQVPIPTSTENPFQMTQVPPTGTPTATQVPTQTIPTQAITPTLQISDTSTPAATETPSVTETPTATPTPYTLEGYQKLYQDTIDNLNKTYGLTADDIRYVIVSQLYREKVKAAFLAEQNIPRTEQQVWARHILVADEATAKQVIERLNAGEDWSKLAAELSTDTSNKDNGGDLGWFGKGTMVAPFEEAAFALAPGQVSQPVQTQFGWHIIQSLGKEDRPLSDSQYQQQLETKFTDWLTQQQNAAKIVTNDSWTDFVPIEPTLAPEITNFINSAQQAQPTIAIPTPAAVTPAP